MQKKITPDNLLTDLRHIIEQGKQQAVAQVNSALVLVYWQVGKRINEDILQHERATYGKQIVTNISTQLAEQYGKSFQVKNLRRMMQFAEVFPDVEIVVPVARQLSWTHFIILLSLKSHEARMFYAQKAIFSISPRTPCQQKIGIKYEYGRAIHHFRAPSATLVIATNAAIILRK